jgi:hypothetical protein
VFEGRVPMSCDMWMPFEFYVSAADRKIINVLRNFHKSTARLIVRLKIAAL